MVKRLTKHGNSLALVIDKPILELLGIDADTPLSVTTDGRRMIIAPEADPEHQERFRAAFEKGIERYGDMLKRLADR